MTSDCGIRCDVMQAPDLFTNAHDVFGSQVQIKSLFITKQALSIENGLCVCVY